MRSWICLAFVLSAATGFAQPSCTGQMQLDANFCAKERWEIADRELNRLWLEVKAMAQTRGTGPVLLNDQRAWLRQRDAICEKELASDGSAAPMFYWSCMEAETLRRNKVLENWR